MGRPSRLAQSLLLLLCTAPHPKSVGPACFMGSDSLTLGIGSWLGRFLCMFLSEVAQSLLV